jgi:uncharacterized caspase-like protein
MLHRCDPRAKGMSSSRTCRSIFAAGLLLASLLTAGSAATEKRVALVIGNAGYEHISRLENPVNDAKLMAETLRSLGFTLVGGGPRLDLDRAAFDQAVQEFGRSLSGADVGLFYFAGHGVQVRGANYLVPVGANPVREADVDFQMLDTSLVLRQMEGSGTRLNLVILDACRNNPFGGRGLRSTASGLATMQAPEGTLISFATQPGNIALDGNNANSPFTRALADTIRKPGLGLFDAFNAVGLEVKRATGGTQQPWVSSSPIGGNFFFAGVAPVPANTAPIKTGPSEEVSALQQRLKALEDELQRRERTNVAAKPAVAPPPVASPQAVSPQVVSPQVAPPPSAPLVILDPPAYPPPLSLPSQSAALGSGNTIISQSFVKGQDECDSNCSGKVACRSYRFEGVTKLCTLLNSADGIRPKAAASSPNPAKPALSTQTFDYALLENGLECRNFCARDKRCRSFMYDPASKVCQLLEGTSPSSFNVVR